MRYTVKLQKFDQKIGLSRQMVEKNRKNVFGKAKNNVDCKSIQLIRDSTKCWLINTWSINAFEWNVINNFRTQGITNIQIEDAQ